MARLRQKACERCGSDYLTKHAHQRFCSIRCGVLAARPDEPAFWERVEIVASGCWLWRGKTSPAGYGRLNKKYTHRLVYEYLVGPIPDGLELDHVRARGCTSLACCNPAHLEPVTHRENVLRGSSPAALAAVATACVAGHPLVDGNVSIVTGGKRRCRRCHALERAAASRRHLASGMCGRCGKHPLKTKRLCEACAAYCSEYQRRRVAAKRAAASS